MRPLVVIEGSPSAVAEALADARHDGHVLCTGFGGRSGTVCCGEVADARSAEEALVAAVGGAGLIVRLTAPREVTDRFLDDLRRLGPVDHRLGERDSVRLTSDQRALLDLLADGVTLGRAAARLGLSRRTADRRLAGARQALGSATTAEALVAYSSRAR